MAQLAQDLAADIAAYLACDLGEPPEPGSWTIGDGQLIGAVDLVVG